MSIIVVKESLLFNLQTKSISYIFGIDDQGLVQHVYWGKKLKSLDDFNTKELFANASNSRNIDAVWEEYPVYGGLRYKEYCLKVEFADGTRELDYKYVDYTLQGDELIIHLKDVYYDFYINLHYFVHEDYDLIERWVSIANLTSGVVEVEKIHSAQFHIPYEYLNFSNFHGQWGCESVKYTEKVTHSRIVFENRRGTVTHDHNPFFILDKDATEVSGDVYYGALKLSGNFSGVVDPTPHAETLVQLGINSHDFALNLQPGESFKAPSIICGYTPNGFETMSHNLHRYARECLLRDETRLVLYNSWEATTFNVQCDQQINLAKYAAEIGCELFVVDDGWFGERHDDTDGLGDWYVNPKKFPNGLTPLIDAVKSYGMKFGIWVEPEMVNPPTQLFKEHPDWIYHYETRKTHLGRNQYCLNVAKPEVKQFIFDLLDNLLSTYEIHYLKWDANRTMAQIGLEKDVWYRHIENVYDIVKRIKEKYPHVYIEACASGGGRTDYGALTFFDDVWTSDNTDACDRLPIQYGYSFIYPIKAMRAWVTDSPNWISNRHIPLSFRFHVAMMGTLGMGGNLLHYSQEDLELAKKMITEYKEIRHIVQDGDFYRLENSSNNDYHLFEYVKGNEVLLFVLMPQTKIGHRGTRVRLRGLNEEMVYEVNLGESTEYKSGTYLMNYGLDVRLNGDYQSQIIKLKQKEA